MIRSFSYFNGLTDWITHKLILQSSFIRKAQHKHFNYTKDRVNRRLSLTPERPDLWTKIIEKSKGPDGLTLDEHHSNGSIFMLAGTETTATALSGTIYHLLRNRNYLDNLVAEIRTAFSRSEDVGLEKLARLKYLQAVLQEGLRMYPPVPSMLPRRIPQGGAVMGGFFMPGGTNVGVHQLATYRMEAHFRKAGEFRPERWLGDEEFRGDHADALEPFSVGPRNCLGKVSCSS